MAQRIEGRERRQAGAVQRVVRVASPYAGHKPLIPEECVKVPRFLAREQQILERRLRGFRAEALERSLVAGDQHPPTSLALVAMLANEHARVVSQDKANNGTSRLGVLRGHLDVQTTRLR
jgi:hypothetical protein